MAVSRVFESLVQLGLYRSEGEARGSVLDARISVVFIERGWLVNFFSPLWQSWGHSVLESGRRGMSVFLKKQQPWSCLRQSLYYVTSGDGVPPCVKK